MGLRLCNEFPLSDTPKFYIPSLGPVDIGLRLQPQINPDGSLHGYEFLVRAYMQDGKGISPFELFTQVEQDKLCVKMDMHIAEVAFKWLKNNRAILPDCIYSLNLCPETSSDIEALDNIFKLTLEHDVNFNKIQFELLEKPFSDPNQQNCTEAALTILGFVGYKVAIDDYNGELYMLERCRSPHVDCVKLDRKYVAPFLDKPENLHDILEKIRAVAQNDNITIIVEGAETAGQVATCFSCGVISQGYGTGHPMADYDVLRSYYQIHRAKTFPHAA